MRPAPLFAGALAALSVIGLAARAGAHAVGLSRGDYTVDGADVKAEVIFARPELISLVAGLDANHDGALTAAEVQASRDAIEGAVVGRVKVTGDGAACPGTLESAELAEQDGIAIRARFRCPARPRKVEITLTLLQDLAFGHRHLARAIVGPTSQDFVLFQRSPSLVVDVPEGPAEAPKPPSSPFWAGALRIARGYEAPVFLLGLLAASPRARSMALAAAAFAAAVAAGIALSALGLFAPAARIAAPAAAISLAYLGIDDLFAPPHRARAGVAIPFGLVHGFAAAEAVRALDAPRPLPAFVAGAVAALTAATVVLLPLLDRAQRAPWYARRGARVIAGAVAAIGLVGLAIRL